MSKKKLLIQSQQSLFRKKVPKMPKGYYSGDKPNQNLKPFVKEHIKERPYDPTIDNYDIPAFNMPIETTKATAIYNMHTYWSKKPHDAIRQYILHYTKPGDLVLDPFCGSGGTALAALMEGRKAIAIDLSPAATFITKNYCTPVDIDEFKEAFKELKRIVKPEIDWLYETRCEKCSGKATTAYTVYSQVFQCHRCMEKVPLFDCVQAEGKTAKGKTKKIRVCPHCFQRNIVEEINTRSERFGAQPVLVSYICESGCKPKRDQRRYNDINPIKCKYFNEYDLAKLREIKRKSIPYWYPKHRMMNAPEDQECWGVKWRAGTSNFRTVDELFTKRNLWALSAIKNAAEKFDYADIFAFTLTGASLHCSKMASHKETGGGFMMGTYYLPQIFKERMVWSTFLRKFKENTKGLEVITSDKHLFISTQSSTSLEQIANNSIDHIFTDPPYADKIQYGELNFVWEAWLGFDTQWHDQEIIVNKVRGTTEVDWANMMHKSMSECYRVLKPGRWLSLCFHHTDPHIWELTQDMMAEIGFLVDKSDSALFIDTGQKSYNQLIADKVSKRDLVVNYQKPKKDDWSLEITITGNEDKMTFNQKVHTIIKEYLESYPGSTKDRIYDEVISRMVREGIMEAHNFEELLKQVADEVKQPKMKDLFSPKDPDLFGTHQISRWYLKETEADKIDSAESAKEDAAAEKNAIFIRDYLKKNPENEGVHYSDIFENYIYTVKDKPRRSLADWLPDYFFKTDTGTWRLPSSKEEENLKAEGRAKGINRRIKRYVTFIEQGVIIHKIERVNETTLAEWIRHCKRSGLYDQGKLLYEKGGLNLDNLPEDIMVNVEEDYQVCVRMITRGK